MLDLIAAAGIGGITVGALVYLAMKERVTDLQADLFSARDANDRNIVHKIRYANDAAAAQDAHTRCSDALETARNRIERALEQITPGANATVQRIARILCGEQV